MSDLGNRRRKARIASAQRSGERQASRLQLKNEAFSLAAGYGEEGDEDDIDFSWSSDAPTPRME